MGCEWMMMLEAEAVAPLNNTGGRADQEVSLRGVILLLLLSSSSCHDASELHLI